jgi:hypothetical protein
MAPDANAPRVKTAPYRIFPQPLDRCLTIFQLRRERRFIREPIFDCGDRITVVCQHPVWALVPVAAAPTAAVNAKNQRWSGGRISREIKIELQSAFTDSPVNEIAPHGRARTQAEEKIYKEPSQHNATAGLIRRHTDFALHPKSERGHCFLVPAGIDDCVLRSLDGEMITEKGVNMLFQFRLRTSAAIVREPGVLKRAAEQKEMSTRCGRASEVERVSRAEVVGNTMETASIYQARRRREMQVIVAQIGNVKLNWLTLAHGEMAAILNRCGAVIDTEDRKALFGQPATHFAVSATDIDYALAPGEPPTLDGFDEFLLWLLGFPKWIVFWICPLAFPFGAMTLMRPVGEETLDPALQTIN